MKILLYDTQTIRHIRHLLTPEFAQTLISMQFDSLENRLLQRSFTRRFGRHHSRIYNECRTICV